MAGVSLRALLGRLEVRPPALGLLGTQLADLRAAAAITHLAVRFLDDRERAAVQATVRAGHAHEAAEHFCEAFSERHFPLDDSICWGGEAALMIVPHVIPYASERLDWDERCELLEDLRPGYQLLWLLCGDIADPDLREQLADEDPWRDGELLARVPEGGWTPETLLERLHGTPFAAAAEAAAWIHGATGNPWLDRAWDDGPDLGWDQYEALALAWREAQKLHGRVQALAEWLEADFSSRASALLDVLAQRESSPGPITCAA